MEDKLPYQDRLRCGFKASSSLRHGLCSDHLYNNKCSRSKSSCSRSTDLLILVLLDSLIPEKLQRHPDGLTGTRVAPMLDLTVFRHPCLSSWRASLRTSKINQFLKLHLLNLLRNHFQRPSWTAFCDFLKLVSALNPQPQRALHRNLSPALRMWKWWQLLT